ncbi:hypothetical protein CIB95_14325 [Lottiidibacillus patelloidae]|uniref:Uncharacterized protein n=1 Tax=Lottiidibacillus patelloidae TaxID=2670334 RepID=A0A263BQM4_9BACI|nr:hypothetical protein [Lottiidibacillus patelloidae]OZM56015.1 hypothetical protein CIB95_14325 [Lottiidibacillus patelloidae]
MIEINYIKKSISNKTIVKIFVTLFLLLVFFFITTMMNAKEKSLTMLEEALITSNVDQLQSLLSSEHPNMEITKENVEILLSYLDNFKKDKESLLDAITKKENHELLSIKTKKKMLFFEEYAFVINPYYIEFEVDEYIEEIEITGVETLYIKTDGKVKSGPLFPKTYEINVTYKTEYISNYKTKKEIVVTPVLANDQRIVNAKVQTQSVTLDIYNGLGATVLLNGKETDIILDEPNKKIYGIPTDGTTKIAFKKSYPWGEVISEEQKVNRRRIGFYFSPVNEQVKSDIKLATEEFSESFNEAFQKKDVSILKHVTPYMRTTFQEIINDYAGKGKIVIRLFDQSNDINIHEFTNHEINNEYGLPKQEQYYSTFAGHIIDENGMGLYACTMYYDLTQKQWYVFRVFNLASQAQ